MKTLQRHLLPEYEIPVCTPTRINCLQFGATLPLLGLVDRLIDDANRNGADIGVAVVRMHEGEHCAPLAGQDGLFTAFVRGEQRQTEQVVQCVLQIVDSGKDFDALRTLACSDAVQTFLVARDTTGEYPELNPKTAILLRFCLEKRMEAGLPMPTVIVIGADERAALRLRVEILEDIDRKIYADLSAYLREDCFVNSFTDGFVTRCSPEEAVALCEKRNYRDAMICMSEPYALWAIESPDAPVGLDRCTQVVCTNDIQPLLRRKARIFDAGLFAFAAMGLLHGDATLADCMKDEALRDHVGHAFTEEILPFLDEGDRDNEYIITCFERYGNPLLDNELAATAHGMICRFRRGVLPALRAYSEEHFAPPPKLTSALAAMILLYADARMRNGHYETVLAGIPCPIYDDPEALRAFSLLASDMPAESLAYAVLADRVIWQTDLREIDGLEQALTDNFSERLAQQQL